MHLLELAWKPLLELGWMYPWALESQQGALCRKVGQVWGAALSLQPLRPHLADRQQGAMARRQRPPPLRPCCQMLQCQSAWRFAEHLLPARPPLSAWSQLTLVWMPCRLSC